MKFTLRPYQKESVDAAMSFLRNERGNGIVIAPTGAGKSCIIAEICKRILTRWPEKRICIVQHRKELIEQNAYKVLQIWPDAPIGIYSAGLKKKQVNRITVGGIQTIANKTNELGWRDLIIVDECHLIPKDGQGQYRKFIEGIKRFNPKVRIIGLTATAFRLDSGLLTADTNSIFTDTIYEISLRNLIDDGFLSNLVSKVSGVQVDLDGVRTRGGEYVPGDIEKACDKNELIDSTVRDIIAQAGDRSSWILFCSGVQHATHVAEKLTELGINSAVITGETPAGERSQIIADFKAKRIRAITNCDVLTTGFDAPGIDVVALLRPTKSTGLYVQMVGRGSRLSPGKKNCLILDYAGNIERHGPIDEITIKQRKGKAVISHAPCRACPNCGTMLGISLKRCTECGFEFPEVMAHVATASERPILAETEEFEVRNVVYTKHVKEASETFRVTYELGFNSFVSQFLAFGNNGFRGVIANKWWQSATGIIGNEPKTVDEALERVEELGWPVKIRAKKVKKYYEVIGVTFDIEVDKWGKVENRDRGLPF